MFLSVTVRFECSFMRFVYPSFSGPRLAPTRVYEAKQCRATTASTATMGAADMSMMTVAGGDAIAMTVPAIVTETATAVTTAVATIVTI